MTIFTVKLMNDIRENTSEVIETQKHQANENVADLYTFTLNIIKLIDPINT